MANSEFPSWEEWSGLKPEQREYSLYKTLQSMDRRLSSLESRGIISKAWVAVAGFIGGACAYLGKEIFIK